MSPIAGLSGSDRFQVAHRVSPNPDLESLGHALQEHSASPLPAVGS